MNGRKKIACPYCGYLMPIEKDEEARARGIWVRCKGRNCGKEFEIKIESSKDK